MESNNKNYINNGSANRAPVQIKYIAAYANNSLTTWQRCKDMQWLNI